MDIGRLFPDLHVDAQLRRVDVHLQMGVGVVQKPAHILADLHAVHGKMLVRPLGLHLEGLRAPQLPVQIVLRAVEDGVLVLGAGPGPGGGDDAEHLPAGGVRAVQIAVPVLGLHVDGALLAVDVEAAVVLEPAADIGVELVLEGPAVQSLEDHLAQLEENDLVHDDKSFLSSGFPPYYSRPPAILQGRAYKRARKPRFPSKAKGRAAYRSPSL